ncbi:hypothetical protein K488DRAFT_12415, partial [Vararia minispora EC-137]
RPPHLPFRRISLPSSPAPHRLSIASIISTDSLLEEPSPSSAPAAPGVSFSVPSTPSRSPARRMRTTPRPISVDGKRNGRKRELKPVDESKEEKRKKVIGEFYETERTYVQGLDLIYSRFLEPIIASLDTPTPLLERSELTAVFSNFIDIWNLHRAFFSSLTEHLRPFLNSTAVPRESPPPMSPLLLSHFPYLSLYTPFVTSFHTSVVVLTQLLTSNTDFATFIAKQEADPLCGKLKLRDWLLTIVQRCPRYLLLLKDLIGCTDLDDAECQALTTVHTLVSKITSSLNASLHTHAQTLALLALQRATSNLPIPFITPGRTFLKRGTLSQSARGAPLRPRDFLLFSDCLLWLESADAADLDWPQPQNSPTKASRLRPQMLRSRSRSEAELGQIAAQAQTRTSKRQASSGAGEERWTFKGKAALVDVDVVVPPADELRFDVLSPEESFAVYADSRDDRDAWVGAVRNAKAALFVSLGATHPNSTLTSSASTHHLRRALRALPHLPADDARRPRRGRVEHFVPAVWIPDAKTDACMRCAKPFGWRRRRHHCRLCGRCVCSTCSGSTFFISDEGAKTSKPARACDACYDTVFPIITPSADEPSASMPSAAPTLTLSALQQQRRAHAQSPRPPSVLMALDSGSPKRALARIDDADLRAEDLGTSDEQTSVVRIKGAAAHPRSFHQILQDFGGPNAQSVASLSTAESSDAPGATSEPDVSSPASSPKGYGMRREDTARRAKRFSLPAVALQTTSVFAHAAPVQAGNGKRFSLVLG